MQLVPLISRADSITAKVLRQRTAVVTLALEDTRYLFGAKHEIGSAGSAINRAIPTPTPCGTTLI